jgi:hypothetical protein
MKKIYLILKINIFYLLNLKSNEKKIIILIKQYKNYVSILSDDDMYDL